MSIQIKSLTTGTPVKDTSQVSPMDTFNLIPSKDDVYSLYVAAKETDNKKTAIVKGLRLVNTHTAAVTISIYFNRPNPATGQYRRRLIAPADIVLAAGCAFIDDSEITLEPGDKIQAKASVANVIQYLISGVERDMV